MTDHQLFCDPHQWDLIHDRLKPFEVRLDDRDYQVGDRMTLRRMSQREVKELRDLESVTNELKPLNMVQYRRLSELRNALELHAKVITRIRLSGLIVPAEPHWWKPNEAMQHGVVVLGLEVE